MTLSTEERALVNKARWMGEQAARNAASWVADGNTSKDHIRRVLNMLTDGDPGVDFELPAYPTLSGQWADAPTPLSIARDVTSEDDPSPDVIDMLADAWEAGVEETFYEACEAELRRWID